MTDNIIVAQQVVKTFGNEKNIVHALGPVDLEIKKGSFTLILGRSGSGKSTFLNLMAGLDKVTSGNLLVGGNKLSSFSRSRLANYRSSIGIIFQSYNLLPNLTAVENVMMGAWAGGKKTTIKDASELLAKFDLSHRESTNIKTLSGGEKQRVAIARSLISNPEILFCDEPTGALDTVSEDQVMKILLGLKDAGLTIVMVSHNPDFEKFADTIIKMKDGKIVETITK